jgi:hypothetical protein
MDRERQILDGSATAPHDPEMVKVIYADIPRSPRDGGYVGPLPPEEAQEGWARREEDHRAPSRWTLLCFLMRDARDGVGVDPLEDAGEPASSFMKGRIRWVHGFRHAPVPCLAFGTSGRSNS